MSSVSNSATGNSSCIGLRMRENGFCSAWQEKSVSLFRDIISRLNGSFCGRSDWREMARNFSRPVETPSDPLSAIDLA